MLIFDRISGLLKPCASRPPAGSRGFLRRLMKGVPTLALLCLLLCGAAVPARGQATGRDVDATIRVLVTDSASHAAIEGAHVEVAWATSSLSGAVGSDTATTDSLGAVRVGPVPRIEPVSIMVRHPSYVTLRLTRRIGDLASIEVRLRRCSRTKARC